MGGIVLRELDRQLPTQNFGSIITLGSPNRGGALLNALTAGTIQAELNDGCNHVAGAIGSGMVVVGTMAALGPQIIPGLGELTFMTGSAIAIFRGKICDEIINSVNATLPTTTAPQTVADLSESTQNNPNALLDVLNNSNTPTFKIGVFGVENSPVHMRLLSSLKPQNAPFNKSLNVSNTDQELVDLFNVVNDVVTTGEVVFIVGAALLSIGAIWNWPLLIPAAICAWAAYEWGGLRRWLDQSESKWHAVIGAGGFFSELVNRRVFICDDALNNVFDLYENRQITLAQLRLFQQRLNADPNCFTIMPQSVSFPINNQSDGLFNAGTQRIPLDPNSGTHVVNRQVNGVNHREFFNHPSMTQEFTTIFAGNSGADPFFITN
jgi:hypothetical protein